MNTLPCDVNCGYFDSVSCGDFDGLTVSPHRIVTRFEIEYYLDNARSTYVDDIEYPIRRDHVRIVLAGQHVHTKLPFRSLYVKFSTTGLLADKMNAIPKYFLSVNPQQTKDLIGELILLQDNPSKQLLFYHKLFELLNLLEEDSALQDVEKRGNLNAVECAKRYMDTHFASPITLSDIAKSASLSATHFHKVFKTICRMTPLEYLTEKRINAAKEILCHTQISMAEIAEKCGYESQQYFSHVFKSETRETPSQYRKRLQENYWV